MAHLCLVRMAVVYYQGIRAVLLAALPQGLRCQSAVNYSLSNGLIVSLKQLDPALLVTKNSESHNDYADRWQEAP